MKRSGHIKDRGNVFGFRLSILDALDVRGIDEMTIGRDIVVVLDRQRLEKCGGNDIELRLRIEAWVGYIHAPWPSHILFVCRQRKGRHKLTRCGFVHASGSRSRLGCCVL